MNNNEMSKEMSNILNEVDLFKAFNKVLNALKINNMASYANNKKQDHEVFGLAINKKGQIVALLDPDFDYYFVNPISVSKTGNLHISSFATEDVVVNFGSCINPPDYLLETGKFILIYNLETNMFSENLKAGKSVNIKYMNDKDFEKYVEDEKMALALEASMASAAL